MQVGTCQELKMHFPWVSSKDFSFHEILISHCLNVILYRVIVYSHRPSELTLLFFLLFFRADRMIIK